MRQNVFNSNWNVAKKQNEKKIKAAALIHKKKFFLCLDFNN